MTRPKNRCVSCNKELGSNRPAYKHKECRKDFVRLCKSCHERFDKSGMALITRSN